MKKRLGHIIFLIFTTILFTFSTSHICQANGGNGGLTFREVWADAGSPIVGANLQDGLDSPYCLTISPDNNNVYVTGFADNALVVFDRAANGALTFREVWADAGSPISGANLQDGLGMGQSIVVSPDGNSVYVVGSGDNALVVFDRAANGSLTFREVWADAGSSIVGANLQDGLNWASGVAVSPNNNSVYVTAEGDDALVVFDRAANGSLTFREVWADDGSEIVGANIQDGLGAALHVFVSSDNNNVYTTAAGDNALVVFDRAANGALTFREVWADDGSEIAGANIQDGLGGAFDIDVSPNDESVYATGSGDDALLVFDRAANGALTFREVWADAGSPISGANTQDGLDWTGGVAVSSDNNNVYVTGSNDSALVVFDRAGSGALTFREVWADDGSPISGANTQDGLAGVEGLDVSADNNSVYVAGSGDSAAVVFDICQEPTIETQDMFISPITNWYPCPELTITDGNPPTITAANDIRITIPSNLNTTWSVTGFGTISGTAAGKIDTNPANVTYADSGMTMIIDVITDFAANDNLEISYICKTVTAGGTSSGEADIIGLSVDGDSTPEATDPSTWTVAVISLSSDANQTFYVGGSSTLMSPVTITEDATNVTIKSGSLINLEIPSGFNMTWDNSIGTATIGGSASGKVSTSVSYSGDHKTVKLSVTTDFSPGEYITVSGLKFKNFTDVSSASNLRLQTSFFAATYDDKTIEILEATQDTDGDGILNINETNTGTYVDPTDTGTDPNDPDTDDDGLNDGDEVNTYGTDPTDPESDGDGYYDGEEVRQSSDPSEQGSIPTYSSGDYYVSATNGNDYGSGTQSSPFQTLHHAIGRINSGNPGTSGSPYNIYVDLDTYSEGGNANSNLVIGNDYVNIMGASGSRPVLDGTVATNWVVGIETSGNNITIKNLEIRNFSMEGILISGNYTDIFNCNVHLNGTGEAVGTGIQLNDTVHNSHVTIQGCDVHDNGVGDGIGVIDADNVNIKGCDISNNTLTGVFVNNAQTVNIRGCDISNNTVSGISVNNTSTTNVNIETNLIEDNPTGIEIIDCSPTVMRNKIEDNVTGIYIKGIAAAEASPTIWNNIIYPLDSFIDNGIGVNDYASPLIYHNTIDGGSGGDGIYVNVNTSSGITYIKYNIITNFNQYGIKVIAGSCTIDYNDVCGNTTGNYNGCSAGTNDISDNPLYEADYSIPYDSPCVDAIPKAVGDAETPPVDLDFVATKRPKDRDNANVGNEAYDMGAYEYPPPISYEYSLPGGTGIETDYRIFTVPVHISGTLKEMMEIDLGSYDPSSWRVFGWNPTSESYIEIDESLGVEPGDAFWIISINTTPITFEGSVYGDGGVYVINLDPGWNLFGLPWTDTSINLGNIAVSDGMNNYWITSENNTLTQKYIWDYTGTDGYVKLQASGDTVIAGKGYWINVLAGSPVKLLVPPVNSDEYFSAKFYKAEGTSSDSEDEEPPPPPGGVGSDSSGGVKVAAEGGCFIATASYGSALHPYVKILRDFRDTYLLSNDPGKTFVALYYRYSPPLAELISDNTPLKYLTRLSLLPLIGFSAFMLYAGAIFKCAFLVALLLILVSVKYVYVTRVREG